MKKVLLSALAFSAITSLVNAQGKGGSPWSYQYTDRGLTVNSSVKAFPALNMDLIQEEDKADAMSMVAKPYRISFPVDANINLKNSGSFTYLDNGDIIWSVKVQIPGAIVIDAFFNEFDLPKGVKLYFYNDNKRQIDGYYDETAENEFGSFRSDFIQGDAINIELNIPSGTNLDDIKFNINQLGASYRGGIATQIAKVYGNDGPTLDATQADDTCHVNANCFGYGTTYYEAKQSTAHIVMGNSVCTGNMINNTAEDCKPLFITASHCEGRSSFSDATFANWRFYFNYESDSCNHVGNVNIADYVTGAYFKARSIQPSSTNPNDRSMRADHLLLELKASKDVLEGYDVYLGGWDRNVNIPTATSEKLWVNFSHPGGIRKKVMLSDELYTDGTFNQNTIVNTHWRVGTHQVGGTQGGSSGSALFHAPTQRIIGVLSGGPAAVGDPNCPEIKLSGALFAKLTRAWFNTAGEGGSTDSTALEKHLDPIGSNAQVLNSRKLTSTGCESTSARDLKNELEHSLTIYPNPASSILNVKLASFNRNSKYEVSISDMFGKQVGQYTLAQKEGSIDVSALSNGLYLVTITDGTNIASKKVVISR